ncbi:hypothetical protein TSMEX_011628 [Taenia solium]|eukprot:TsM_001143200 transcript=TsM_001143200 gene=TsM_001143200
MALMDAEGLSEPTTEASEAAATVIHAVGEMEARLTRQRHPTVTLFIVEALTLARDGGILDWDDRVCDVLDDRELNVLEVNLSKQTWSEEAKIFTPYIEAVIFIEMAE